jgi:Tetratricopeptide repeat
VSAPHHLSAAWRDADALRTRGQLQAARDLLEPVADVAAIRLGADNPDVIETMRRLATVHRELGELASARRVLEEALEGAQLRLGDDDPVVLGISADLGAIADELGNRHEARRNFTRVARYGPTVFGPQHPQVRAAQRFLSGDQPVAEPAPEAQAGFAPAAGYEAPPAGYEPRHQTPPFAQEQPGVYRPAERSTAPVDPFATPVPVPPYPEPPHPHEEHHRSRLPLVVLAVVAVAALVAATVIGTLAFRNRHATVPPPQAGPTTASAPAASRASGSAAAAPRDVKLRDDGNLVTVTWTDPSGGTVPFFVEAGPAGGQLRIMGQLRPGETTYPVVGLNPRLDYCFSVVAVYSSTLVAPSDLACTQRTGKPAPSQTH